MRCRSREIVSTENASTKRKTYGSRNVATPSCPVDVDILANLVCIVGVFWLDPEGVCAEVITLCLQQVGGEVLGTVTVVEAESGAESGGGNSPESTLGDNAGKESVKTFAF
jgi:hypothetical protein